MFICNSCNHCFEGNPYYKNGNYYCSECDLKNPWVWSELTQILKPDRKAGSPVPVGYLSKGASEYFPYSSWIKKGYVERV